MDSELASLSPENLLEMQIPHPSPGVLTCLPSGESDEPSSLRNAGREVKSLTWETGQFLPPSFYHLLSGWHWVSFSTSVSLSFLIRKVAIIMMAPNLWNCCVLHVIMQGKSLVDIQLMCYECYCHYLLFIYVLTYCVSFCIYKKFSIEHTPRASGIVLVNAGAKWNRTPHSPPRASWSKGSKRKAEGSQLE